MDAVITFVNGNDPVWQQTYAQTISHKAILNKRYRDWGFLPYLLRGIEKNMPFIEKVFLIVSTESQVPCWVNTGNTRIILHKEIIPQLFLPTFNSTTIELFLHRIPDLSEQFVYFNDDLFPVNPLQPCDLFQEDKIVTRFSRHLFATNLYKQQTRRSDQMARLAAGLCTSPLFLRPQHTITPMLRSVSRQVYQQLEDVLAMHITPLRRKDNCNQYLYTDYLYHIGRVCEQAIPTKHCSMAIYSGKKIADTILHSKRSIVCINDVEMSAERQQTMRATILQAFETHFPQKSRFEK